jgi:hypothetical protein
MQPVTAAKRRTINLMGTVPLRLDAMLAWLILATMFVKVPGVTLVPIGVILLVPLTPMLIKTMGRTKPARRIAAATIVAVMSGLLLRFGTMSDNASSNAMLLLILVWVAAFPIMTLGVMWAFERVDIIRGSAVMFAVAAASAYRLDQGWKGSLGITITLLLLAFFARRGLFWTRLTLIAVTVMNGANDARTTAAIAFIVFLCTFLTRRQLEWIGKYPKRSILFVIAAFTAVSYALVNAMTSGLLGPAIQQRTLAQTSNGRDLLTSGRAEWAATLSLFGHQPLGFGTGVTPDPGLQTNAVGAVRRVGGDYLAHYWSTNVFPERTDLHSTVANLWAHYSLGGVILAAVLGAILLASIPLALSTTRALGAMPLFAVLNASWDLAFSPMADSDRLIMGLVMSVALLRLRASEQWPLPDARPRKIRPTPKPEPRKPYRNKHTEAYLAGK